MRWRDQVRFSSVPIPHHWSAFPIRAVVQPFNRSPQSVITSYSERPCDPYAEPGNLYTSDNLHDSRYIIYNDPTIRLPRHHNAPNTDWIVPSFSADIHNNRLEELDWMRNRTVLLVGDSIDRNLVIHFGRRALAGTHGTHAFFIPSDELKVPNVKMESHQIGVANLPELNLTIYNWFLMGLSVTEEVPFFHPREDLPQNYRSRIERFYLPLLAKGALPRPDLVIFNSGYWDLDYLARARAAKHQLEFPNALARTSLPSNPTHDLGDGNPLNLNELAFHRSRLRDFVRFLRASLEKLNSGAEQPISYMYRSMQLGNATERNAFSPSRVRQLDESNRMVMREMGVRVLEWGKMTIGLDNQLSDPPIHYGIGSAQYIFGDMMLFYLKQHVLGTREQWIGCKWIQERYDALASKEGT
ncbi:hypothetical protein CROQUDRAFT_656054 [Cronartium quercuum f. sp. fusiforme G11]|uniref:Uncharacterized protein n=1 Tax=Cronartium quercuum f. sp. fusiforme G11 TaxID=708437 RepID=A0A9P6NIB7_9BASI|nr:hypothetical protein CROQUDRAFT_656054 [Cronartium quercuum f. sp. fusiforme G11]